MKRSPRFQARDVADDRHERLRRIDGWDQDRLAGLRMLVFGAGALGNEILKNLALSGVGHFLIVDFDTVEISNLSRSVLFRASDAGKPKAEVAAGRLREIDPAIRAHAIHGDLHHEVGPGLAASFDVAISCLDSIDARLGVDRICRRARLPWWNGGLGAHAAELTRFDPIEGPCYACTLTTRTLARESRRWSCQDGSWRDLPANSVPTTIAAAALGASLLTHAALTSLMPGFTAERLEPGRRILVEAMPPRLTPFLIPRNPGCPAHAGPEPEPSLLPLDRSATGIEVLRAAEAMDETEVHLGFDLVTSARCRCPDAKPPVFAPSRRFLRSCPACGSEREDITTSTSLSARHPAFELPLVRLGVADGGEILLNDRRGPRHFRLRPRILECLS